MGRLVVLGLVIGLLSFAGCLEPNLVMCANGRACGPGLVCEEIHQTCVTPAQLTACEGMTDGVECTAGTIVGVCVESLCVEPGCGNTIIEPGELCDDGNRVSGDGCTFDCRSDERCGNARVDDARGETCDDGNLVSHDGCDSQCTDETVAWRAYPMTLEPNYPYPTRAFDAGRRRLVVAGGQTTWEWNGSAWTVAAAASPVDRWLGLVYNPDRARILGIGIVLPLSFVVAEWDGTSWTTLASTGSPPANAELCFVVYDDARDTVLVGSVPMDLTPLTVSGNTATWGPRTTTPFPIHPQVTRPAYDATRQRVVTVEQPGPSTWEWNGASWTQFMNVAPTDTMNGIGLVYDGARSAVLAIGGSLSTGQHSGGVYRWTGTSWTATGATIPPRAMVFAWYDPTAQTVGVVGGQGMTGAAHDMLVIAGTSVTTIAPALPTFPMVRLFNDSARDRVLALDSNGGGWIWNGTWQPFPSLQRVFTGHMLYEPARGGVLLVDTGAQETWLFTDAWQQLAITWPQAFSPMAMTYDYDRRRVVAITNSMTYELASTGAAWTPFAPGFQNGVMAAAYDSGYRRVVVQAFTPDPTLLDLINGQWEMSLSAGASYTLASSLHSESLLLVPQSAGIGAPRQLWERRRGVFAATGRLPAEGVEYNAMIETAAGRNLFVARDGSGWVLLERQAVSELADETCGSLADTDGDGVSGCADADCWAACNPLCPLATSCPP